MPKAAPPAHSPHPHSPHETPRDPGDAFYDRLLRVQHYAETHWRKLAGLSAFILACLCVAIGMRQYRARRVRQAAAALFAAEQETDAAARLAALDRVAKKYARTGGGLQAAFAGAQLAFEREDFATARTLYELVLEKQPASPLAAAAALGVGTALEAAGRPEEAATAYERARTAYESAYTMPQAQWALGRLAEARGEGEAALAEYRAIVSAHPGTAWEREASQRIAALAPAVAEPPPEPVPVETGGAP